MSSPTELLIAGIRQHDSGNLFLAEQCYRQAVALDPHNPEIWYALSVVYRQLGRQDEMLDCARRFEESARVKCALYNDFSLKIKQAGCIAEARQGFQFTLGLNPDMVEALSNLAGLYQDLGQYDEALSLYKRALAVRPDMPELHVNIGLTYERLADFERALEHFEQAIRIQPHLPQAHNALGNVYLQLGRFSEAESAYRQALQLHPSYADPLSNLGFLYQSMGQPERAIAYYNQALQMNPAHADAQFNRTLTWLQSGDYRQGWAGYEARYSRPEFSPKRPLLKPMWDGSSLEGKRLLIMTEQGMGDTLQMLRFLPVAKARGGYIILACQPELVSLLQGCNGVDELLPLPPQGVPESVEYDLNLFMMSLPYVLGITLENLPGPAANPLRLPQETQARWQDRFSGKPGFKVGVAWSGNVKNPRNRNRACPVPFIRQLMAQCPDVHFYSLQKGPQAHLAADLNDLPNFTDLASDMGDFTDTAAIMQHLDLIVSVDTVIAHLAGLLGRPTWLMLPYSPDWRWMDYRTDTPWYPTLRLFRQSHFGDWEGVVSQVVQAMAAHQNAGCHTVDISPTSKNN